MTAEVSVQSGVCLEYQRLLATCQLSLTLWQHQRALLAGHAIPSQRGAAELKRLRSQYARACAELESHEHVCPNCQFVSKIAGLDFECMSSALDWNRRS